MGLEIGFLVGAIVLLGAMIYGVTANRRRNRANDPVTDQATRELYRDQDAFGRKEDELRAKTES